MTSAPKGNAVKPLKTEDGDNTSSGSSAASSSGSTSEDDASESSSEATSSGHQAQTDCPANARLPCTPARKPRADMNEPPPPPPN